MLAKRWALGAFVAVAAVGLVATPALAEKVLPGFYGSVGGGFNLNDSDDLEVGGVDGDLDTELGFVGLGSFGYSFGNGFRTEVEGGYRHNNIDDWNGIDVDGDIHAWHAMVNALYDFSTGTRFSPYVGAGIGAAFVTAEGRNGGAGVDFDDMDVGFAYQGIIGLGYNLTERVALTTDYRFFHAIGGGGDDPADNYMNHSFVFGLRYAFGKPVRPARPMPAAAPAPRPAPAPAPAPAPEPEPAVPNSYLVFFEFDSAALTPESRSIVETAASNALRVGRTRIEVTGHTDRVGARQYNMVLAQRRAQTVVDRLVDLGIPRGDIAVYARGEEEPLIPTGDGVREPQNRRVEIILL